MTTKITYSCPDTGFWAEYETLWMNSLHKPVFKSPRYVRYLTERFAGQLAICRFTVGEKLCGIAFFRKDGNTYRLLTDLKADHNFLVIHRDCTREQVQFFFRGLLAEIKKENWVLTLRAQPVWAPYIGNLIEAINQSGLFWNVANRSVCPVLEEATPQEFYKKLNDSRELRYRVNRIKNQLKGTFEIFTGEEDLEAWTEKFCELHRKRWEGTMTPSRYESADERLFLKNCLTAWANDNLLVRFSVRVEGERIAFVICLRQQNTLVHHSTAYDDNYRKYSPGKALILVIAEWMQQHDMNVLDFGEGAEPYKYEYANKELELNEISIAPISNLPFILKVKARQLLRERLAQNPKLKNFIKKRLTHIYQFQNRKATNDNQ